MRILFTIVLSGFLMLACKQPATIKDAHSDMLEYSKSNSELSYAEGFTIAVTEHYKYLTVLDPWNQDTLATYLIQKKESLPKNSPSADFIVQLPVQSIACLSSPGFGILSHLNSSQLITAATDPELIYDSLLYNRVVKGDVVNLGKSTSLNTEVIINHKPDLIIKHIYGGKALADTRLKDAGIPIVYHLEFMENHPLGRAEWIKFFAAFLNKSTLADSIFKKIKKTYLLYSSLAKVEKEQPSVLDGSSYKGVWYAAGGKSFQAQLYADAGAHYYWKNNTQSGSISLSFESIIEKQSNTDFWIGASTGSRNELLNIESRYELLKPFRNDKVFYFGKRINPNGGLDYFESGIFRPDILLTDLLWVFHPHLLDPDYDPVYIQRIN